MTLVLFAVGQPLLLLRVALSARRLLVSSRAAWVHRAYARRFFAGSFAAMVWERSFTPAVVDTEKFMDVAFLSSIWRAPHLPPPDPWFSGQPINYYYFGHYLIALVAKVLGTVPGTAPSISVSG